MAQGPKEESAPIWEKKTSEGNAVTAFSSSVVYKAGLADEDEQALKTQ